MKNRSSSDREIEVAHASSGALMFRADPLDFLVKLAAGGQPAAPLPSNPRDGKLTFVIDHTLAAGILRNRDFRKWNAFPGVPETLGGGLISLDQPEHTPMRRTLQPAFHPCMAAAWEETIRKMTEEAILAELGAGTFDLMPFFERLTLRIAGRALFGLELGGITDEIRQCVSEMQATHYLREVAPPARKRFSAARKRLDALLLSCRRSQPDSLREGVIFRLLSERGGISEERIQDEFHSMLLPSSVTTALSLANACHHLAHHPEFQKDCPTEAVILETLRLHPPVWANPREAIRPGELAGMPYEAGDHFLISPWTLHRDPKHFPAPESFRPQRWADGLERRLPPGAFIPFSLGARSCIGERFAKLEMGLALSAILRKFHLSPAPSKPPLTFLPHITLVPENGVWVTLSKTTT